MGGDLPVSPAPRRISLIPAAGGWRRSAWGRFAPKIRSFSSRLSREFAVEVADADGVEQGQCIGSGFPLIGD
jgi:hypothetical protein